MKSLEPKLRKTKNINKKEYRNLLDPIFSYNTIERWTYKEYFNIHISQNFPAN